MACCKVILHYKNVQSILLVSRISLFATKTVYFNTKTIRPIFTGLIHINYSLTNLENVKDTMDVDEFKRLNFSGTKYVTLTLQKLLKLSNDEVRIMLKMHPKYRKCTTELLESNYKLYKQNGISVKIIRKYPLILTVQDANIRLLYIKQMSLNLNSTAPLLIANINTLKSIVINAKNERQTVPYGSRIVHISKILNVPEWEISERLVKHSCILRIPIERLEKLIKILLEYGVEPQNIMNDFWALRYSPATAERRLQQAIDANVPKVKAWMIRCVDDVFERCINRQIEHQKILGSYSSIEEYLSQRLDCSVANAKYLTDKYPAILKMSSSKMKEMIDYLFEKGYTPGHICRVPRILVHSLETTKFRMNQLKEYGVVPPSLAILCKSKKDYDKYLKKYIKKD